MSPTVTEAVFAAVADRARPLLTYYGPGAPGAKRADPAIPAQRVGLSAATLENWSAKIANYLRDEAGLLPGDSVIVDLPEHWQSAATLLGAWWAGLRVVAPGDEGAGDARVVFTTADRLDDHPDAEELIAVPLDPFGGRVPGLPAFAGDFGDTVRPHGDHFSPSGAGPLALGGLSVNDVLARSAAAAGAAGITAGMRVLSTRPWRTGEGIVDHLLAPLVTGAALVWADPVAGLDLPAIAETEKTGLTLG
ncbi:TIGR03089 family protein [Gordonia sp. (in: high G+C Gram-positive bacteria)]|uniref:TIGR03089 family protein n=1 Tax=Gordonia sp. (in: high G+C Gram-positive bacteria) TaxID=84139 RepID=UPI0035280CEA